LSQKTPGGRGAAARGERRDGAGGSGDGCSAGHSHGAPCADQRPRVGSQASIRALPGIVNPLRGGFSAAETGHGPGAPGARMAGRRPRRRGRGRHTHGRARVPEAPGTPSRSAITVHQLCGYCIQHRNDIRMNLIGKHLTRDLVVF